MTNEATDKGLISKIYKLKLFLSALLVSFLWFLKIFKLQMWLTLSLLDSTGIVYITGKQGTFSNGNMPLKEHSEESLDIWMYKLNKKRERKNRHALSYVVGIQYLKKENKSAQINGF